MASAVSSFRFVFDPLRPDETVKSGCARVLKRLPCLSPTTMGRLTAGGRHSRAGGFDFPQNIPQLIELFAFPGDVEAFIWSHTMLPWLYALGRPETIRRAQQAFRAPSVTPAINVELLSQLGIHRSTRLNGCPACAEEDSSTYGSPHWRRWHQVPGLTLCSIHRQPLLATSISREDRRYHPLQMDLLLNAAAVGPDSDLQRQILRTLQKLTSLKEIGPGWASILPLLRKRLGAAEGALLRSPNSTQIQKRLRERYGVSAATHALRLTRRGGRGWDSHIFNPNSRAPSPVQAAIICAIFDIDLFELAQEALASPKNHEETKA